MLKTKKLIALFACLSIATTFAPSAKASVEASVEESNVKKFIATTKKYSKAIIYSTIGVATFAVGTVAAFSSAKSYLAWKKYFFIYRLYIQKKHYSHSTFSIWLNHANQEKIISILKAQFSGAAFLTSLYAFTNAYNAMQC